MKQNHGRRNTVVCALVTICELLIHLLIYSFNDVLSISDCWRRGMG